MKEKSKDDQIGIRVAGFGGQGVILFAKIVGKAVAIYEGKDSSVMQSYGPEARGSACSGSVAISDSRVGYPYVIKPDIFVALSKDGYVKYRDTLKAKGILIIEDDLVELDRRDKEKNVFSIPATKIAEELGKKIVANIIMLGYFTKVTGVASYDSMKKSVLETVPAKFRELNEKAFDRGYFYGEGE